MRAMNKCWNVRTDPVAFAAQQVMNTVDFNTSLDPNWNGALGLVGAAGSQVVAIGAKITNSLFAGVTQIGMNTAGYYLRGLAGIVESISPGTIKPLPAPTPFLQMVDSGATLGQQINSVTTAFIQSTVSGGLAFLKMGADMAVGNYNALMNDGVDALTMLLGFKLGEAGAKLADFKLKVKQMAFDAQRLAQGIISKSPLEFLKKGPDGLQLNIIKDKVIDPTNPTAPPVEVTKVLTSEQLAQECSNSLVTNADGSVEFQSPFGPDPVCFVAGTLVHTKDGLRPIEQIKVGDWVLSKHESGEGEQAYKRVSQTFVREQQEVWVVDYFVLNEVISHSLVVTENHPLWVVGAGWSAVKNVKAGDEFELFNYHDIKEYGCVYRVLRIFETEVTDVGWTYDYFDRDVKGPTIDLRNGLVKVSQVDTEDVYNDVALEMGKYLKRQVFNIEVQDFHTYYVGEAGVWVHNACLPQVAGNVEAKRVVLNNAAEANAGLTPSKNAFVYSYHGADALTANLADVRGLVLIERNLSQSDAAALLAAGEPGSMNIAGSTSVVEWGLLAKSDIPGVSKVMAFESRIAVETPTGMAYTRTFNDVKMSVDPLFKLNSKGELNPFGFRESSIVNEIQRGYEVATANDTTLMFTLPDTPSPGYLHSASSLQRVMMLVQERVLNDPNKAIWGSRWMFRDMAAPDVVYSFNKDNLLPGAMQFQVVYPDGTLGPTLWKGQANYSTVPLVNDFTRGPLAGNTTI